MYRNHGCLHIFHLIISRMFPYLRYFFPKSQLCELAESSKATIKSLGKKIKYIKIFQKLHSFKLDSQLPPFYQHCITITKIHLAVYPVCWASKDYHPMRSITLTNWSGHTKRKKLKRQKCAWTAKGRDKASLEANTGLLAKKSQFKEN